MSGESVRSQDLSRREASQQGARVPRDSSDPVPSSTGATSLPGPELSSTTNQHDFSPDVTNASSSQRSSQELMDGELPAASHPSTEEISSCDTITQAPDDMTQSNDRLPILQSLGIHGSGEGPAGGQQAPALWRSIILHDWAIRSVTLSSLALRVITAAQATVYTSLVAGLLLERSRVPLSQIAHFSMSRSINGGPRKLIQEILFSISSALRLRWEAVLLVVLAATTTEIQFTSTILLPDVRDATMVDYPSRLRRNVTMSPAAFNGIEQLLGAKWSTTQGSNALFGEVESRGTAEPNEHGVSDTGHRQRSFLPFEREDREKLRSFKGPAVSLDTRVSCLRPSMRAWIESFAFNFGNPYGTLAGEISMEQTFKDAGLEGHSTECYEFYGESFCLPRYFNCTIPSLSSVPWETESDWPATLCRLPVPGLATENDINVWQGPYDDPWSPTWIPFLTVASNAVEQDMEVFNERRTPLNQSTPFGEWSSHELLDGVFLNVTLCFARFNTTISDVEMETSASLTEPEFEWTPRTDTAEVDRLREYFEGGDDIRQSTADRGILTIRDLQYPATLSALDSGNLSAAEDDVSFSEWALWHGPASVMWSWDTDNQSVTMCSNCQMRGFSPSKDGGAVFVRAVNAGGGGGGGRAALAIDAYLAKLAQNFYYLAMPLFDVAADVEVVFATAARAPQSRGGLAAVLAVVSADLVVAWAIAALYARGIRYTRQGNCWHAVAQLVSEQTRPVLDAAGELKDAEVSRMLRGEEEGEEEDPLLSVGRSSRTGRVKLLDAKL